MGSLPRPIDRKIVLPTYRVKARVPRHGAGATSIHKIYSRITVLSKGWIKLEQPICTLDSVVYDSFYNTKTRPKVRLKMCDGNE
jgi:hypothetical protein